MATVSKMSRYVLDSYYKAAAGSSYGISSKKKSSDSTDSLSDSLLGTLSSKSSGSTSKSSRDSYSKSDSVAALMAMSGMNSTAVAKKTANSSSALMKSSLDLVQASNYKTTARSSDTVGTGLAAKVKKFAEDYNSTIKSVQNSDNVYALRYGVSMVDNTKAFSKSLKKIGITVNDDNTLTVDEDKLNSAKVDDVRRVFSGSGSYGSRMVSRSINLNSAVKNEMNGTGIYSAYSKKNNAYNSAMNFVTSFFNSWA